MTVVEGEKYEFSVRPPCHIRAARFYELYAAPHLIFSTAPYLSKRFISPEVYISVSISIQIAQSGTEKRDDI